MVLPTKQKENDMSELSKNARSEIIDALRQRYRGASKSEKRKMLDEFADVSGYHRKHLIRLMSQARSDSPPPHRLGARVYDAAVRDALVILWEAADRICGKRLKAALPLFIKSMEAHGHLRLADGVRADVGIRLFGRFGHRILEGRFLQ